MHKVYKKDIMDYSHFPDYDIIWTDPPWEDKMVKFFQTLNYKQTGVIVNNSIDMILNKLFSLASVNKPIIVEYSIKGIDLVKFIAKANGHQYYSEANAIQNNNLNSKILVFNSEIQLPNGIKGYKNTTLGVRAFSANIVFDPFAGIGKTAKAVIDAGATYIGSELNEARYNKLCHVISLSKK